MNILNILRTPLTKKSGNLSDSLTVAARQAIAEQIPGGTRTLRLIKRLATAENLKRLAIALLGGTILFAWLRRLGEKWTFRMELRKELEKQLAPINEKLEKLEEQNDELMNQNEQLRTRLAELE